MVPMLLLVLAAIPLLGIAWIVYFGSITTVGGLFMSLILLSMSGIMGTTALFELRRGLSGGSHTLPGAGSAGAASSGGLVRSGKVQEVVFFEANVGEPNKSIVTLSLGSRSPQMLVVEGDVRNAIPVGQKVQITLRKEQGRHVLVNVRYS